MAALTTQNIVNWLAARFTDQVFVPGPYLPDMPDDLTLVTAVSGPGLNIEDTFDAKSFHIAVRGSQRNLADAEARAFEIDDYILDGQADRLFIAGIYVYDLGRVGGTPNPLPDTRDAERITFTCTYYFNHAR